MKTWMAFLCCCLFTFFMLIFHNNVAYIGSSDSKKKNVCNILESENLNKSETYIESNFDYKKMFRCFNLNENLFFNLPYVSHILFERVIFHSFANHIYSSKINNIKTDSVKCGDIIYVKTDFIKDFLENYHPDIKHPYILITHESDYSIGYPWQLSYLNKGSKLIMWYGQNVITKHPKIKPLPIGLVAPVGHNFSTLSILAEDLTPYYNRSILLYFNFSFDTNRNRSNVLQYFSNFFEGQSKVILDEKRIGWPDYLMKLKNSRFVISPPGNGIDCIRTWEALAMGAVPIVLKSELQPLYDDMPVMVVNDWKEVTMEKLDYFQTQIKLGNNGVPKRKKLWLRYWITEIMRTKENYIRR